MCIRLGLNNTFCVNNKLLKHVNNTYSSVLILRNTYHVAHDMVVTQQGVNQLEHIALFRYLEGC